MPIMVNSKGFVYDSERKHWLPPLNLKQFEIFNCFARYVLIHGPRKSGKTFGILHKIIRHAFDVKGAMAAIVCKTIKNAKAAGVWVLLTRMLRIWEAQCPGFMILEGPKTTGDTKMSFVRIKNRHGSVSEIQCHSLENAHEVEAKFKGPAYSFFWLSEFDQYCDEHAFDIFCDALRMWPDVAYEEHQIICDCNPPDTGTSNWIHDKWFKFKDAEPSEDEVEEDLRLRESLHRMLVMLDDNPQLDPRERADLEARYRKRKALYNRFVKGLWEMDVTDGHFSDVFDPEIHVLGKSDCAKENWEVIIPTAGCVDLLTGWDIGESKNHSFHILEKIMTEDATSKRVRVSFSILDEVVVVREKISVEEFVLACMEKIHYWNEWQKKRHNVVLRWRHWSDTSAFDFRANADTTDAAIVYEASRGEVALQGAPKYRNSNRDKVKLIWQLLYEERLHISAHLFTTLTMLRMLRKDPTSQAHYVKRDDHKHPFDSMTYPILAEAPMDMYKSADLETMKRNEVPRLVFAGI